MHPSELLPHLQPLDPHWAEGSDPRASAVLCLFMNDPVLGLSILFTRRSSHLKAHAGQVGFPGGRREAFDASPGATALRETEEEVGLAPQRVELLGTLPSLKALDLRPVTPLVGYTDASLHDLRANPGEVAEMFLVPWERFRQEERTTLRWNIFGRWRETPHFAADGHNIWGLTAWMLSQLAPQAPADPSLS